MKGLPPSRWAKAQARRASATREIQAEGLGRPLTLDGPVEAPGTEQPDDEPDDHADADLFERDGEELAERAAEFLPEGQFQEDEEERDGDAVVQTALDVQRLADPDGDLQVVHDHRPQCGVRGREDGAEESGLHERQSGKEEGG